MHRSARRLGAATTLALVAGLASVSPASAAAPGCGPAPAANNNNTSNQAPVAVDDTATVTAGAAVRIPVLANDTDPDGDALALVTAGRPDRGAACTTADGALLYRSEVSEEGYTTTFTYGMTDGDRYRTARVNVEVVGLKGVSVAVQQKLIVKRGKVTRAAEVSLTNPNSDQPLELLADGGRAFVDRTLAPGQTIVITTRARQLQFLSYLLDDNEESGSTVNTGFVNTVNGRIRAQYLGGEDDFFFGPSGPGVIYARLAR